MKFLNSFQIVRFCIQTKRIKSILDNISLSFWFWIRVYKVSIKIKKKKEKRLPLWSIRIQQFPLSHRNPKNSLLPFLSPYPLIQPPPPLLYWKKHEVLEIDFESKKKALKRGKESVEKIVYQLANIAYCFTSVGGEINRRQKRL